MHEIQVSVSGYHHKLITLVEKIIDKVVNFEVEGERFSVIKVQIFPDYFLYTIIEDKVIVSSVAQIGLEIIRLHCSFWSFSWTCT